MAAQEHPAEADVGRSALRKVAWRVLPLIALGYGLAMVDRTNISFAALQMNRDLGFSDAVYGLGAGIFFLSYTAFEIPSNLLLHRVGARRWIARIMLTWGVIAMGMMFVRTPWQFYTARFLLGVAEAGFFPGAVYYVTQWFPSDTRGRAISRFYVALPLSTVIMGSVAGALLHLDGKLGLAGWQWLFVVEGLPTLLLSAAYLLRLPDDPTRAKWLSETERGWLSSRLAADRAAQAEAGPKTAGGALSDPRVWILALTYLSLTAAYYAYGFNAPLIIRSITGLDATRVGFVVAGMSLLGVFAILLNGLHSDRVKDRRLHVAVPAAVMAAAYLAASLLHQPWGVIACLAVVVACASGVQPPLWSMPGRFLSGRSAAAGLALINTIGNLGGFFGPYWMGWMKQASGDYRLGLMSLAAPSLLAAFLILSLSARERKLQR
jgi:ACS family tartrate transporter-like MFS transporter